MVAAVFNDTFIGHALDFGVNVCFQCLGDRVLFLAARLAVGWYADGSDECAFAAAFGADNVSVANE